MKTTRPLLRFATATFLCATVAVASAPAGKSPAPHAAAEEEGATEEGTTKKEVFRGRQIATMSELMVKIIYPTSDAILYISTRTPTNDVEWNELQGKALMLAESANLLLSPIYAWDDEQWIEDTKLMLDAGEAAYEAALEKDVDALAELNDALYTSCIVCHKHYRPGYGD